MNPLYLYIHALHSIKRDFDGIPIMVVSQPEMSGQPMYREFIDQAFSELKKGYKNGEWYFMDMNRYFQESWGINRYLSRFMVDTVHLSNEGQKLAADLMAKELTPAIKKLVSKKGRVSK